MKCHDCNLEEVKEETYCSVCGELLIPSDDTISQSEQVKKNNKRFLIAIMSVLGMFIIAFSIWFMLKPSALETAKNAYQSNDVSTYEKVKDKLSKEQRSEFDTYILQEAGSVVNLFKSDGIYYKEAIRRLEKMEVYLMETEELDKIISQVEVLNSSQEAYNEGKIWLKAKEWDHAKSCFETVVPIDENYESARKYLESIKRWQLQEIGVKALEYLEQEDYEQAVHELMKGLEIDPTNETLLNIKQTIEDALNQPPVSEEVPAEEKPKGLSEIIKDGLQAIGDGIKSFFDGSWLEN